MAIGATGTDERRRPGAAPGPVAWLSFGAAPAFAAMAVITGVSGDPMAVTCLGSGSSVIGGMSWMYLMMSIVHLPPWLKLLTRRPAPRPTGAAGP